MLGLEAEAWLALAVLAVFGTEWVDLGAVDGWESLIVILALALAYVLGVIVDRLADSVWGKGVGPLFGPRRICAPADFPVMRLTVIGENEGIAKFLDYQRSRLRVARGTVVNLVCAASSAAAFLATGDVHAAWVAAVIATAGVMLALTVFAAARISDAYDNRLIDAYRLLAPWRGERLPEPSNERVAAAVCYRHAERGYELLLVRTKGGRRWTFPKGHVESGETARDAAAREAREEAGVTGQIRRRPTAYYAYPAEPGREHCVPAFLLEVRRQDEPAPAESVRAPEWLEPAAAAKRLAHDREERYAAEHRRVVAAVQEALRRRGS